MIEATAGLYAKSLFEAAQSTQKLDSVGEAFTYFMKSLNEFPELETLIQTPAISRVKRQQLVDDIFHNRMEPLFVNFLHVLIVRNRAVALPMIFVRFQSLVDDAKSILRPRITTAVNLDPTMQQQIAKVLAEKTGKSCLISYFKDPSILGGFIVSLSGIVMNFSLKHTLSEIKHQLNAQPIDYSRFMNEN